MTSAAIFHADERAIAWCRSAIGPKRDAVASREANIVEAPAWAGIEARKIGIGRATVTGNKRVRWRNRRVRIGIIGGVPRIQPECVWGRDGCIEAQAKRIVGSVCFFDWQWAGRGGGNEHKKRSAKEAVTHQLSVLEPCVRAQQTRRGESLSSRSGFAPAQLKEPSRHEDHRVDLSAKACSSVLNPPP